MASHHELGKYGEQLAKVYLEKEAFTILHQNWKYSYYEIDIIGCRKNILHFIEIKTRKSLSFGFPEEDVNRKKLERLMFAAEAFLNQFPEWERVQYDILSIRVFRRGDPEYFFIEDVSL